MSSAALELYLAGIDSQAAPGLRALDAAITAAYPGFDIAIKYRLVMYTVKGQWRNWVCAIGPTTKSVTLRFLYGVLLDDPLHVLRAGSSVLMTWDFAFDAVVDPEAVGGYVREAVAKHSDYLARQGEVLQASHATARERGLRR